MSQAVCSLSFAKVKYCYPNVFGLSDAGLGALTRIVIQVHSRKSNFPIKINIYALAAGAADLISLLKMNISYVLRKFVIYRHFDASFYEFCYGNYIEGPMDPLDHYLRIGSRNQFDPNPDFSSRSYMENRASLRYAGDPLYDFLRTRAKDRPASQPADRKVEYFTSKRFDAEFYLAAYDDVRNASINPLEHYVEEGWREGRDPNPTFSTKFYLGRYADAKALDVNPLYHYVRHGAAEGRRPCVLPDTRFDAAVPANENAKAHGSVETLLSRLAHRQPDFPTKWLRGNYLASGLSELQRARYYFFHYDFIIKHLSASLLEDLVFHQVELWSSTIDDCRHSIIVRQSSLSVVEGELSLEFNVDGACLYVLSFTIIPKDGAGEGGILVSRMQGVRGLWDDIKRASRRMKDVSPPFALMAALQGLAQALDIESVFGVSARRQAARGAEHAGDFNTTYDQFFLSIGATEMDEMLFAAAFPLPEKPMSQVKPGHRIRTRAKRELKREIAKTAQSVVDAGRRLPSVAASGSTALIRVDPRPDIKPARSGEETEAVAVNAKGVVLEVAGAQRIAAGAL
jgi:uncharacterized protein VirK/YbjX